MEPLCYRTKLLASTMSQKLMLSYSSISASLALSQLKIFKVPQEQHPSACAAIYNTSL